MRILGIDYGEKKIGLAISEGKLPEPLGIIETSRWRLSIKKICQEEKIERIVIGVSEGKSAKKSKLFAREIKKLTNLPVEFQDETLTSKEALAIMKKIGKKGEEDAISAALILEAYLEKGRI